MATGNANDAQVNVGVEAHTKGKDPSKPIHSLSNALRSFAVDLIIVDRAMGVLNTMVMALDKFINIGDITKRGREILDYAEMFDVGTTKLQAFLSVTESFGAETSDTIDALNTLNEYVEDFINGTGRAEDFKIGGFSKKDFVGKDVIDRYLVLAEKLPKLAGNVRANLISKLLGDDLSKKIGALIARGDVSLLSMMNQIIKQRLFLLKDELDILESTRAKYTLLTKTFSIMWDKISLVIAGISGKYLPAIQAVLAEIATVMQARVFIGLKWITEAMDKIAASNNVVSTMTMLNEKFEGIGNTAYRLFKILALIGVVAVGVFVFMNPAIILIVGALAMIGIILEDIWGYFTGDNAFTSGFFNTPEVIAGVAFFKGAFNDIIASAQMLFNIVLELFTGPFGRMAFVTLGVIFYTITKIIRVVLVFTAYIVQFINWVVEKIGFGAALFKDFNTNYVDRKNSVAPSPRLNGPADSKGYDRVTINNTTVNTTAPAVYTMPYIPARRGIYRK